MNPDFIRGKMIKVPGYSAPMYAETVADVKAAGAFTDNTTIRIKFRGHFTTMDVPLNQILVIAGNDYSFRFRAGIATVKVGSGHPPLVTMRVLPDPRWHPIEDKALQKAALAHLERLGGPLT